MITKEKVMIAGLIFAALFIFFTYEANQEVYCWSSHGNAEYYYPKGQCDEIETDNLKIGENPPIDLIYKNKK